MSSQTDDTGMTGRLDSLAERVRDARASRQGDIAFTLTGSDPGSYTLHLSPGSAAVDSGAARGERPLLEVVADSDVLRSVLDGEVDAREQYFKGGLLVHGDLRYLSNLALELGILTRPL